MGVVGWEPERGVIRDRPHTHEEGIYADNKEMRRHQSARKGWGVIRARREGGEIHQGVKGIRVDAERGQDGAHTDLSIRPGRAAARVPPSESEDVAFAVGMEVHHQSVMR